MRIGNTNKKIKKFLPVFLVLMIIIPIFSFAEGPFVPNCSPNCDYDDLLKMVKNIIDWIVVISVPIATGVFAWAGFLLMTTGVVDKKSDAKEMMRKVLYGFVFILSAWLIVTTITNALLREGPTDAEKFKSAVPMEGVK